MHDFNVQPYAFLHTQGLGFRVPKFPFRFSIMKSAPYVLRQLKDFFKRLVSFLPAQNEKRRDLFIHRPLTRRYRLKKEWMVLNQQGMSFQHFKEKRILNGVLDLPCNSSGHY